MRLGLERARKVSAEFDLIRHIQSQLKPASADVVLGIGDDAAVLSIPDGMELVATTDCLNSGIHFSGHDAPEDIGYKCLAVNLSDLAAMGATPRWVLMSLSLPEADPAWVRQFIQGFNALASEHEIELVGGDTCRGLMSVSMTALGWVPTGKALTRSGAHAGDLVVVSGNIGEAGLALRLLREGHVCPEPLAEALHRPQPRVALGRALLEWRTPCIDISDGLLQDLGHIARQSGCAADLFLEQLPITDALKQLSQEDRWDLQLTAGDDYELCFCWPSAKKAKLARLSQSLGLNLNVVGVITRGDRVRCLKPGGGEYVPQRSGHEHFR